MADMEDVVILGGGFVGLMVARQLARAGVIGKACEVTVVDKSPFHVYTPWLYEVSSGYLSRSALRRERCTLSTSASVAFENIPGYRHVRFRRGMVTKIDPEHQHVFLSDGLTLGYTTLIVALGSEPNFFGIPGFPQYGMPIKSPSDAVAIEKRVRELVTAASRSQKSNIVIVGGGATGVELTGELIVAIHTLERKGEIPMGAIRVTLVDRAGLLSTFPEPLGRIATKRLKKLGAHLITGTSVTEATERALVLKDVHGDTSILPCDLCIWTGGVMPSTVVKQFPFPMDPKGRIIVDSTFAVKGVQGVYAAGDCASLYNPLSKEVEPMSAQSSVEQGTWIAKNILRSLKGSAIKPFPFRTHWDVLITVGGRYGVGHVFGFVIRGPLAFVLRRITDGRYFFWILPFPYALKKWLRGVVLYDKNDG